MEEKGSYGFVLDNSLAAVSAVITPEGVIAADGVESKVYAVAPDGSTSARQVLRPYRRMRRDIGGDGTRYTALGDCRKRIYLLDGDLRETGFFEPGGRDLYFKGEAVDAGTVAGSGGKYYVAFDSKAMTVTSDGKSGQTLYVPPYGARLTDVCAVTESFFAASYVSDGMRFVAVRERGREICGLFPRGLSLRMIFAHDDGIYALYGSGYVYNRIAKIYSSGELNISHLK